MCIEYQGNIFSISSGNSEATDSEFIGNLKQVFPLYLQLLVDNKQMTVWTLSQSHLSLKG